MKYPIASADFFNLTLSETVRVQAISMFFCMTILLYHCCLIYVIVPLFTSVSTPVYALFGRTVNMFCTPNDTSAPVNWGVL